MQQVYLAHVRHWPPYHKHQLKEGKNDIPLASFCTEMIKWEVLPVVEGGKECKKYWKVYEDFKKSSAKDNEGAAENSQAVQKVITLEFYSITGEPQVMTHILNSTIFLALNSILSKRSYGVRMYTYSWV